MTHTARKLLEEALALPDADRRWLAEALLERVSNESPSARVDALGTEAAWTAEAVERLERAERGQAKLVAYDEVRAHVEGVLRRR